MEHICRFDSEQPDQTTGATATLAMAFVLAIVLDLAVSTLLPERAPEASERLVVAAHGIGQTSGTVQNR